MFGKKLYDNCHFCLKYETEKVWHAVSRLDEKYKNWKMREGKMQGRKKTGEHETRP